MSSTSAPYSTRDLWATRPGGRIFGQLYLPANACDPLPTVICSHVFGGSYRTSGEWAALLAREGLCAYAFDFCGATLSSKSEGPGVLDMSIRTEQQDLLCVIDALRALAEVDKNKIYLLGQSQGGLVSAMAADERPQDVAGLFLMYPGFTIHNRMLGRFGSPENVPPRFSQWQPVGRAFAVDAMAYDPFEHMDYAGPVHIWHGDCDGIVPITYSERAERTYPNATLHVVSGAEHEFSHTQQHSIAQQIAGFIRG